jgi:hypothetical protein
MKKTKRHSKTRSYFSFVFPILTIIGIGCLFAFSSFYEKSWSFNWNGISEQVRDSIKVAEYGGISSGVIGVSARRPKQFDRRIWIMKNATEKELLKLTEYPNSTIKTIAYEGLLRRKDYKDKTNLVLKSLNETEYPIDFQMGCVGSRMYISEYLIDFVLYLDNQGPPLPDGLYNRFRLAENDVEKIMTEYKKTPSLWK